MAVAIITNITRMTAGLATFETARDILMERLDIVRDICEGLRFEKALAAIDGVLRTALAMAVEQRLVPMMLSAGYVVRAIRLIFRYDASAASSEDEGLMDTDNYDQESTPAIQALSTQGNAQVSYNSHAMLAAHGLARMLGLDVGQEGIQEPHVQMRHILRQLLTPGICRHLLLGEINKAITALTTSMETPLIIWNQRTRTELVEAVDGLIEAGPADETGYDMTTFISEFEFESLKDELVVGDVYIRVFNKQPTFSLPDPAGFIGACFGFLDFESKGKAADDAEAGTHIVPERKRAMIDVLQALQGILQTDPALCAHVSSSERIQTISACISACFMSPGTKPKEESDGTTEDEVIRLNDQVMSKVLGVLSVLVGNSRCLAAMAKETIAIRQLFLLAFCNKPGRGLVIKVLTALAGKAECSFESVRAGGVVFLLALLVPGHNASDSGDDEEAKIKYRFLTCEPGERAAIASLLARLTMQEQHGTRVSILLSRFLPEGVLAAIKDGNGEVVTSLLAAKSDTPELIWKADMALDLGDHLEVAACALQKQYEEDIGELSYDMPEQKWVHPDLANMVVVGGVYVELFNKDPTFPLRNPKRFSEALFEKLVEDSVAARANPARSDLAELVKLIGQATVSLLRSQSLIADHICKLGYVPKVSALLTAPARGKVSAAAMTQATSDSQDVVDKSGEDEVIRDVRGSSLRVIHQLSTSTSCVETFSSLRNPDLMTALKECLKVDGATGLSLETMKRALSTGNRRRDILVRQAMDNGLVNELLDSLDWKKNKNSKDGEKNNWTESDAAVCRVLVVEILWLLASEGPYKEEMDEKLASSEVWKAYKDQRHDLFLPSSSAASEAGVAGLLTGSSATTLALPSTASPSTASPSTASPPPAAMGQTSPGDY